MESVGLQPAQNVVATLEDVRVARALLGRTEQRDDLLACLADRPLRALLVDLDPALDAIVQRISRAGGTPLIVAERTRALGVIHLQDVVKGGMRERFSALRAMAPWRGAVPV